MSPMTPLGDRRTMPRTIQCPDCGVVLNVPEAAAGRRLRCPKCGTKFTADGGEGTPSPPSSFPELGASPRAGSSTILPTAATGPSSRGDIDLPTSAGSLRDTFDLPMLGEDLPSPLATPIGAADPMGLFREDPPSRRKPMAAEAKKEARRCPTCSNVVPRGMSLCSRCGLDLDSGVRVDLTDDLEPVVGPRRPDGIPIGLWVVGGLSISLATVFGIIAIIKGQAGESGYLFLLPVSIFGIYAAVQFLRERSVKLLLVALTMGVCINVVALIALPVIEASTMVDVRDQAAQPAAEDPDEEAHAAIGNINDHLDTRRLGWGIAILFAYGAVAFYLNSPPVKRRF